MYCYLPNYEILFYISVYMGTLCCGFYHLYWASEVIADDEDNTHFDDGWKFLNRKRDDLDYEWEAFTLFIERYIYWYIYHAVISEIVRFIAPKRVPIIHAIIGLAFIFSNFSEVCYLILFLMLLSYYIVMRSTKRYIWSITVLWLIVLNVAKQDEVQDYLFKISNEFYTYEVIILSCWVVLRLISFSIDYANARISAMHGETTLYRIQERFTTCNYLAYILYVPTILIGPPFIYARYEHMIEMNRKRHRVEEFLVRLKVLIQNMLRVWFWWNINDFFLHFFYTNNIIYNVDYVETLNIWAFYGLAFSMGQYFFNKYTVSYGFGIAIADFDRIDAPGRPKCVAYIHLYSNMWRYFDQGLHEFLFKYIYAEIRADSPSKAIRYFASFLTFNFIFFWHGCYKFIFVWAILNFICLHLENFGKKIVRSNFYCKYITWIGKRNCYRLNAIAGSQLYILAVLSNMVFIGGTEVGMMMMKRTYYEIGIVAYIILSFCCYCVYHTSEFIWQIEREFKKKKEKEQ